MAIKILQQFNFYKLSLFHVLKFLKFSLDRKPEFWNKFGQKIVPKFKMPAYLLRPNLS
jgi:hypothetical protein